MLHEPRTSSISPHAPPSARNSMSTFRGQNRVYTHTATIKESALFFPKQDVNISRHPSDLRIKTMEKREAEDYICVVSPRSASARDLYLRQGAEDFVLQFLLLLQWANHRQNGSRLYFLGRKYPSLPMSKGKRSLQMRKSVVSADTEGRNLGSENREPLVGQQDGMMPVSGNKSGVVGQTPKLDATTDAERIRKETAATKAQAAFRGYLARRAFKALKGIIRLQALIRGHLVRRQAVATLYCVIGIVKLQAIVRGSRIRCSGTGLEVQKVCALVKPQDDKFRDSVGDDISTRIAISSANAFVRKLLAPSPTVMPLQVQYGSTDPNSILSWLERWSSSCPWKPASPPKKVRNQRFPKKQGNPQTVEAEPGRPKHSVRKVLAGADNLSLQAAVEFEKPRRNLKKVSSNPAESVHAQGSPQNELEKVKRNLRKVHGPVSDSSAQPDVVNETQNHSQAKVLSLIPLDFSGTNEMRTIEKARDETTINVKEGDSTLSKPTEVENTLEAVTRNEMLKLSNGDQTMINTPSPESKFMDESTTLPYEESKFKEDSPLSEHQKSGRRASFPAKHDRLDDGLQNTPKLPSYMAATESAKAKLRGQGSPRFSQDGDENNNLTRRHSGPSSVNGKVSSASPRTQRPAQGKAGNRSERSVLSSRYGNGKVVQAEWRR
ncbi:hypothetical protein Nepgr_003188 [Nepenthes gracilis]|uniref:DUF4005 domain-containing protein n=1 Tax=Nepenthes gracilis TaxID=150966 RepID=A0AAD3XD40_NEPGR|nr:hypothetical protein Nepgr_003188 [Nepenthes gracilis]